MKKYIFLSIFILIYSITLAQEHPKPQPVNINTQDYQEFAPTLSADGKTMIFQSNRMGGYKLFESSYSEKTGWSEPKSIDAINSIDADANLIGGPCLSADGNTLYFCAIYKSGMGDMDIYVSKREKNGWSKPENIGSPVNTPNNECFPSISPDEKKLFYTTHTIGPDSVKCLKIMMSEKDINGKWTTPKELSAPLNASCDKAPRMAYDNKNLIFSTRKNNTGGYDLYRTQINEQGKWSEPIALSFANTSEQELYASLLPSEELMYYTQKGDIYSIKVPNQFKLHGLSLKGKIIDEETQQTISASISIIDTLTKDTLKTYTNHADGTYTADFGAARNYKLLVLADKYWPYSESYFSSIDEAFKEIEKNIAMKPKRREVKFNVKDSETNKGLKVKIKVTNLETKEENIIEASTGRDGKYVVSLREGNKYNVEISSSEGYAFTSTNIDVPLSTKYQNLLPNNLPQHNTDNYQDSVYEIKVQPLKDNTELTLKDIYFDFNKYTLQKASYPELNRVVDLMNKNPTAKIEIAAHTDDVGSDDFNYKLSEKRAQEIVKYLVNQKINPSRLIAKGYGKSKPVMLDTTDEARARNRRVELKIIDIK